MSFTHVNDSDNYRTPKQAWERINKFIPKDKVIWEPFYCDGSSGQHLRDLGCKEVIHQDEDFFKHNHGEVIITNPPFSKKRQVLNRLKGLDKPFICIAPSMMLSYKYFQEDFADAIQIIVPKKRIAFEHLEWNEKKLYSPPFAAFYFCYKMNLEKDLTFIE